MYGRLLKYKNKYKSASVPHSFNDGCSDDGRHLGNWVNTQRFQYKNKILSEIRINQLDSIDFVWNLSNHLNWVEMCKRLVAYKKQYKSTCVPYSYPADQPLGNWVSRQRMQYKTKDPVLTIEKISQLDSIGFVWNVLDAKWTERYERLVAYNKRYNSTCVPRSYTAGLQLGTWVNNQRSNFNTKNSQLTTDRINRLNSIGFVWNFHDAQWIEMYDRLVAYKKKYKSTCVSYKTDLKLGRWVDRQCEMYRLNNSRLTIDRINRLNSIGFIWNPRNLKRFN